MGSQCIRALSNSAGDPSLGSCPDCRDQLTAVNVCPAGGNPYSTPDAVRDRCCIGSAFTLRAWTSLSIMCLAQSSEGSAGNIPTSACPSGWQHQGWQCYRGSQSATGQMNTCDPGCSTSGSDNGGDDDNGDDNKGAIIGGAIAG